MKIGLLFGSFNPIHVGHLIIANYFIEHSDISEVWLVISPHNPLKDRKTLLSEDQRLLITNLAIEDSPNIKSCDVEFGLDKPSYTIDTLDYLKDKYPTTEFVILMGEDNLVTFSKWKSYDKILDQYQIYVSKRPNTPETRFHWHEKVKVFDVPLMEISSTYIRKSIFEGKDVKYLLTEPVYNYIKERELLWNQ